MDEHGDERTAKSTYGGRVRTGGPPRRPREPLWVWLVLGLLVCALIGWGIWAALD